MVGYSHAFKYQIKVEVTGGDKRASLLQYGINRSFVVHKCAFTDFSPIFKFMALKTHKHMLH
jgi:hypothetical protein